MRKLRLKTPAGVVADYFRLFVNRRAYTLQSDRPHAESGRHYYFRPSDKKTGQGLSLTPDTLRGHIEGEITIALYAINPATQRCKWVAIDADCLEALTRVCSKYENTGKYPPAHQTGDAKHISALRRTPA